MEVSINLLLLKQEFICINSLLVGKNDLQKKIELYPVGI